MDLHYHYNIILLLHYYYITILFLYYISSFLYFITTCMLTIPLIYISMRSTLM